MAAIHRNGLPRFRENQSYEYLEDDLPPPLLEEDCSDESTVVLDGDVFQGEDMGEWLADSEAEVEGLHTQEKRVKGVESVAVDITHVAQVERRALADINVASEAEKSAKQKEADDYSGSKICVVMMELLGLDDENSKMK